MSQWETYLRPFSLLLAITLRPPAVFILARKPCLRLRLRWDGWYSVPREPNRVCCARGWKRDGNDHGREIGDEVNGRRARERMGLKRGLSNDSVGRCID